MRLDWHLQAIALRSQRCWAPAPGSGRGRTPGAVTGYAWRPGRVDTGVVLASGTWSRTEAERRCTAHAACNGFFFPWAASNHVPPAPSAAVPVSLTNGTFGQSGTWRNPAFQTYIKQRVPDPLCPCKRRHFSCRTRRTV